MNKNKRNIIIGLVLVIVLGIIAYIMYNKDTIFGKEKYNDFILISDTGIVKDHDTSWIMEGYQGSYDKTYYINGIIKNNSNKTYKYAIIEYELYDSNNILLGLAKGSISTELKSKGKYDFTAMSLTTTEDSKKVAKYSLKSIEGYN